MGTKDLFSGHAKIYAEFRPTYPQALIDFLLGHTMGRTAAWDCATGNGQVARQLAPHFERVDATDISPQQIALAPREANIFYSVAAAESTTLADNTFYLITVAQAMHWINTTDFYREVVRTSRPGCLLAVWGYGLLKIDPGIDKLVGKFYRETIGPYWDVSRKFVDNSYSDIAFPFEQIATPAFAIRAEWTFDHLAGYFTSWSATQKFIREKGTDPVVPFMASLRALWPEGQIKPVVFPIFIKVGRVK